jgi:peptide-methionine (S)-S-oxide reductase
VNTDDMSLTADTIQRYDQDEPGSEATETATFGLGCFWGPDAQFGALAGVVRTRVGYAGGETTDPTYRELGDHTEVVQVDYLPGERSFGDLLELAFHSHDPHHKVRKRQYQSIVFTDTDSQREALTQYLDANGIDAGEIETRLETLDAFYPAEPYHQKYNLHSKRWITDAFEAAGYGETDIRESPAAATLNGYAAGHDIPTSDGLGVASSWQP